MPLTGQVTETVVSTATTVATSIFPMSPEVGAAWMQAIGSIAAILVAIWLSQRQFRSALAIQRDAEQRREQKAAHALVAAFGEAHAKASVADMRLGSLEAPENPYPELVQRSPTELTVARRDLATFPLLDLPSVAWIKMAADFNYSLDEFLKRLEHRAAGGIEQDEMLNHRQRARSHLNGLTEKLGRATEALQSLPARPTTRSNA